MSKYKVIELFAGAGGFAIGIEKAGLKCILLNDNDESALSTLKTNRPDWNVIEGNIKNIKFKKYKNKVDVVTGGFPCQAFSYAGKELGLKDVRGTLFYEFARVVKETKPLLCVGENVKGLLTHDKGRTLKGMVSVLDGIGYRVLEPKIIKAIGYKVPQKRERVFIIGIRKDIDIDFNFPKPNKKIYTLKDALKKGVLFDSKVKKSDGVKYSKNKKDVLKLVPPGGYWKDLPIEIQKQYMGKSFYSSGGRTGYARRLSWDKPCFTLTCSPAQKQTELCHPDKVRPLTVREYARIQTFPDDWIFEGSISQQYKQIGNALPVNLSIQIGKSIIRFLDKVYGK